MTKEFVFFYFVARFSMILSGGIFPENSEDAQRAFTGAADYFNKKSDNVRIEAIPFMVNTSDSYMVQKKGDSFHFICMQNECTC